MMSDPADNHRPSDGDVSSPQEASLDSPSVDIPHESCNQDEGCCQVDPTKLCYDDDLVRKFATATLIWGGVALAAGLITAILLVVPTLFDARPMLSFGRLRPVHTNAALFAFLGNAMFAAVYYSTQRLCGTRMFSDALGRLHFWGWQAIIITALVSLVMGFTQGRPHAEFEWPIDIGIAIVWIGFFATNFFLTLYIRRERRLSISLWFYIASIVTVGILHVGNNLVLPMGWFRSYPLLAGVQDAMLQWWYGHNFLSFLMTVPFLGAMYYFVPKAAGRPIHSYRLAIVHFWSLVIFAFWAGPHHLHYDVMAGWATSLGVLFGFALWMPSWAGVINGMKTLFGDSTSTKSDKPEKPTDPALPFFAVSLIAYALATLEGPLLSTKSAGAMMDYTDWTIAHLHTASMGWNGFLICGMLYWLTPRLFQTIWWSQRAIKFHFLLSIVGLLLTVVPLYLAGAKESQMWFALNDAGILKHGEFIQVLTAVKTLWMARVVGGGIYLLGFVILATNFLMTWLERPAEYTEALIPSMAPQVQIAGDGTIAPGRLDEAPVLGFAKRLDVATQLRWHQRWEQNTGTITKWLVVGLVLATVVELAPTFLIRSSVPVISTVKPYTPLELAGREIYLAEGCFNCHTQTVRPLLAETQRYGDYSQPGEFAYDRPVHWGSRRIGPDLARAGGAQQSVWHWQHLEDPRSVTPESVMPSFSHLLDRKISFQRIPDRVEAAILLGTSYDFEPEDSIELAKQQAESVAADIVSQGGPLSRGNLMTFDSQAVALIAYLQRLGTDLFAKPDAQPSPE